MNRKILRKKEKTKKSKMRMRLNRMRWPHLRKKQMMKTVVRQFGCRIIFLLLYVVARNIEATRLKKRLRLHRPQLCELPFSFCNQRNALESENRNE